MGGEQPVAAKRRRLVPRFGFGTPVEIAAPEFACENMIYAPLKTRIPAKS